MAYKKYRKVKVYEQSEYHYKSTPAIMLKGQWLTILFMLSGQDGEVAIITNRSFYIAHMANRC